MGKTILLLVILRFVIGGFWVEHSRQKWTWPGTPELQRRFLRYNESATGVQKTYLERFAIPNWQTLQYVVIFGELAVGLSFLLGYLTKAAAFGGAFMACNFLFAQGSLIEPGVIGNPYGPVLIMAGIAAAFGGAESRWSLSARWQGKQGRPAKRPRKP